MGYIWYKMVYIKPTAKRRCGGNNKQKFKYKRGKMKKFLHVLAVVLIFVTVGSLFVSCGTDNTSQIGTDNDYPVEGIWHAHINWEKDWGYNITYTYDVDMYYNFIEGGVVKLKMIFKQNGTALNDDEWAIANYTWSVECNTIYLSSGAQFVIFDDEFNDIYPDPKLVLHYRKEQV